jgi:catechol 2,3-dioxygenase-like lactoylglutathione lyase family enzyme
LDEDSAGAISFLNTIPVIRILEERKAREFYCDFLGFSVKFAHRFEPDLPLYLGLSRGGMQIHLSEHHGDASPGTTTFVWMRGIESFAKELNDKKYGYGRPGIHRAAWGNEMTVHDPFGNRIRFCQARQD